MAAEHRVALVVDADFGNRLDALAKGMHVWVVRSVANDTVARRIWAAAGSKDAIGSGVTLFGSGSESPEDACRAILGTIEEHHGEHSSGSALGIIEVYGVGPTPSIRAALAELGFGAEARAEGFVATRRA